MQARVEAIRAYHEAREFRHAAAETCALWSAANDYVQTAAPWSALKHHLGAAVATRTAPPHRNLRHGGLEPHSGSRDPRPLPQ
ncbi:hypothetical protein [Bosea thiooxidans]|uniref:hypothetical protein n=1 Tax=Bosea thiooxidans TaxID=53254 RepID=UPI003D1358A9